MSERKHCDELLQVIDVMERGLRAPLEGISQDHLNHVFAPNKMTIGQIAVHTMAYPRWFMSGFEGGERPWEKVKWTCRPCDYPLALAFVNETIDNGCAAMRAMLRRIDDAGLERTPAGEQGPGYILCRLQLHTMVHANQMSYLRQLLDPDWKFGGHFGAMATAYIRMSYHTEKDPRFGGF